MKTLKVAIASMCSIPGDVVGNLAQIERVAEEAGRNGCHVILTPEMSVTGYGGYDEVLNQAESPGQGPVFKSLQGIAQEQSLVILAGFVEAADSKKYLSHYIIYPDGQFLVQRKHRVTPREFPLDASVPLYFDDTEEIGQVQEGDETFVAFTIQGVRCTLVICADWGIRHLDSIFQKQKTELIFLPVAAGGSRQDVVDLKELATSEGMDKYCHIMDANGSLSQSMRECFSKKRAVAAVNMCGYDGYGLYHGGSGSIVGPAGELCCLLPGIPNLNRQTTTMTFGEIIFER